MQTIQLPERLDRMWIEQHYTDIDSVQGDVRLDFTRTVHIDSAGASLVRMLERRAEGHGGKLRIANINQDLLEILRKWIGEKRGEAPVVEKDGILVKLGDSLLGVWDECIRALSVLVEMMYWGTFGLLKRRDFRRGVLGEQMYQLGFNALGIVGLLALLIGVVLALQTAIQLRQFGADIFLAPMIGISMIRELGPLMTAIILAGRTGSATTAEIATMGVQEEVDALSTMSLNPIQFIVVPKFWAISLTMPLLSIIAVGAGIFGGFLVGVFYLGISSNLYWSELAKNVFFKDFFAGFIKSIVFSWLIIWIGAYYGFKVRGGAEEVGRETTASVVTGIFVIIVADAIFSFILP